MGKKTKRKTYTSKGERSNVSNSTLKLVRSESSKAFNKIDAWRAGKRGYVTIANPNKQETNRRFIKVTYEQYFGGTYKDVKARSRPNVDNDKVEVSL